MKRRFCSRTHQRKYQEAHQQYALGALIGCKPTENPELEEEAAPVRPSVQEEQIVMADQQSEAVQNSDLAHTLAMLEYDRHFYQEILDRAPVGIALVSEDLTIRYSNQHFRDRCQSDDVESDNGFRRSIRALVAGLAQCDSNKQAQELLSDPGSSGSLERVFAVRLPPRDDEAPDVLVVVENPTKKTGLEDHLLCSESK